MWVNKILKKMFEIMDSLTHYKNNFPSAPTPIQTNKKNDNLMEVVLAVVGLKYKNEDGTSRQEILKDAKVGDYIELRRAPMDDYPHAIQVLYDDQCIGYISEYDNKRLAKYLDGGGQIFDAEISRLYENSSGYISVCEIFFYRNKMR